MEKPRSLKSIFNRISISSITMATLTLFILYTHPQPACIPPHLTPDATPTYRRLPKSSCEANRRDIVSPDKRSQKIFSSRDSQKKVSSFKTLFHPLRHLGLLKNSTKVLCVSAGAGHEVVALSEMGFADVTGVEVFDSPPLVSRADPHNLPFFDGIFDLGFSARLAESLFPERFAEEMERMVGPGGGIVVALEGKWLEGELEEIKGLFRRSEFVEARDLRFLGSEATMIIMRKGIPP